MSIKFSTFVLSFFIVGKIRNIQKDNPQDFRLISSGAIEKSIDQIWNIMFLVGSKEFSKAKSGVYKSFSVRKLYHYPREVSKSICPKLA